ncbi:MAG: helix-turn-helix transcriptional regulator [Oscillospiraceae bacterium]|jgi:transcriptional regulator with XRE-family HTH domain|nr:helix-turn-helix transcriptional regulator [Oscillospiraceae bacterium]
MNITISENLRKLRVNRDVTQEELAEYLKVSAQSVSKWERGDNFPDITLLPAIAGYFEVTVDDLLGVAALRDERRIEDAIERTNKLLREERQSRKVYLEAGELEPNTPTLESRHDEIIELWRELAHDMPRNYRVLTQYATWLKAFSVYKKEQASEAIRIFDNILEHCTDDELRYGAIAAQVQLYSGFGDFKKAQEYANKLPPSNLTQEFMGELIVSGRWSKSVFEQSDEERLLTDRDVVEEHYIKPLRDSIHAFAFRALHALSNMRTMLRAFGAEREGEYLKLLMYDKPLMELFHYDEPNLGDLSGFYRELADEYVKFDHEAALDCVEKAVEEDMWIGVDDVSRGFTDTFDGEGTQLSQTRFERPARKLAAQRIAGGTALAPIREHPRFVAAIKRLWDGDLTDD